MRNKNKKANAIVFVVVITTVIAWMIGSISLYTYSIYFRVVDLQSQIYLSLKWESIKDKNFLNYTTDPINNLSFDETWNISNDGGTLKINRFTKLTERIDDRVVPWKTSEFFMTDFDIESSKQLNKVKKLILYYNKDNETSTWTLSLNFVRYNKILSTTFQSWKIELPVDVDTCEPNTNLELSSYSCEYTLTDFSDNIKNNEFNYMLFFSSDFGISYTIEWRDKNDELVKLPSKYLEQDFDLTSKSQNVSRKISSKINLYDKFNLNINKSLYWIN